ncbi:MAG: outer membrane beta-barrel protein [Prevotella sp.]|nr:outer membrane beta-barrel protein [Prevotella sp.]
MLIKRTLLLAIAALTTAVANVRAQEQPEYLMEIGAGGGVVGYLGDFNGNITKNLQPAATIVGRYNINSYMAVKLQLAYGKMKGSSEKVKTYYPDYSDKVYTFSNPIGALVAAYEYNLVPYGTGREYRGAKRLAPYLSLGLEANYIRVNGEQKSNVFTMSIPLGIGLKYKLGERANIGLEWAMHFSLSDELDGVKDPYGIKSSGLFKNTDGYTSLMITATYSFNAKCRTCHNEDE